MIFGNRDDETTPESADSELVELEAPPAPPIEGLARNGEPLDANANGVVDSIEQRPAEDGAGNRAPAPSSSDTEEDDDLDGTSSSSSPVTIRERMAQLAERQGSPGFGVVGKFDAARADYTAQGDE